MEQEIPGGLPLHSAASPSESSLISKLQSSDSPGIHALVSDYLHPLSDLKPTKKSNPDQTLIRSLAKCFLSFLNASLSILPKWFLEVSKSNNVVSLLELLRVYKICLDCLDVVASQLGSKPFFVEFQRLRLIHCLESCGLFDEAQLEGLGVLEKPPPAKWKGKLLPEIDKGSGEGKELCSLFVDIVVSLLRCAAVGLAKEDAHFRKVMTPINSILRLYAAGLLLVCCDLRSRARDLASSGSAKFECLLGTLLENKKILQRFGS
ncbi:hypothetical protein JHK87_042688 [Glycine soja]|nr:hypothetical protein JHK87_042688 [Glycine soja]